MNLGVFALLVICCAYVYSYRGNEDHFNVIQMIQARGYPAEQHYATTPDGFILSIQRITGPHNSKGTPNVPKPVVMLQHGLEDNSITWVVQQVASESLGFILADAGYDVWLPNIRGNTYSTNNTHLSPSQTEFWEWSFDEMANIDLPTILDYILNATGASKLSHVGHSQGTMMGFIAYEKPELAAKVNIFIALAPVAWVYNCKSLLLTALAKLDLEYVLKILGDKDFLPDTEILKILLPGVCHLTPTMCDNVMGLLMGFDNSDLNSTRLPTIVAHEPSGTSIYNIIHWAQLTQTDNFQAYDYGPKGNMQHYNSTTPLQYQPQLVKLPTALFYGGNDDLADPKDVEHLIPLLPNVVFKHFEPNYSHIDFVWGETAYAKIYSSVVQLLDQYKDS
eukprot:Phypoly_transcript_10458.p1 GENE.Phypoly_transcript_10458~~Phypoly_transcript_10458.p1  ORF type:complete len:392 (+),score=59.00 Phypoly_transcript_10458:50-1225(+)